jgi:hypothetical protein
VIAASRSATGISSKSLDRQIVLWRTGRENRVYTTSTKWTPLPMPSGGCPLGRPESHCAVPEPSQFRLPSKGPISLTFSGVFGGGAVEVRFRDGDRVMRPGAVQFKPGGPGEASVSFTFVSPRRTERVCQGPELEWRSVSGDAVQLNRASIAVYFKRFKPAESARCA